MPVTRWGGRERGQETGDVIKFFSCTLSLYQAGIRAEQTTQTKSTRKINLLCIKQKGSKIGTKFKLRFCYFWCLIYVQVCTHTHIISSPVQYSYWVVYIYWIWRSLQAKHNVLIQRNVLHYFTAVFYKIYNPLYSAQQRQYPKDWFHNILSTSRYHGFTSTVLKLTTRTNGCKQNQ